MALLEWPLAMVSSNIALLLLKLRNLNEAGIKGRMDEFVLITKWIFSPLTLTRIISDGKSLLEIKIFIISSGLKVIFAIVAFYRILLTGLGL
ncbi:MAG: hypothetical protein ACYSU5_22130 [Planctomycetota bacterium]